jgi:hypothetical protein
MADDPGPYPYRTLVNMNYCEAWRYLPEMPRARNMSRRDAIAKRSSTICSINSSGSVTCPMIDGDDTGDG